VNSVQRSGNVAECSVFLIGLRAFGKHFAHQRKTCMLVSQALYLFGNVILCLVFTLSAVQSMSSYCGIVNAQGCIAFNLDVKSLS